MRLIKKPSLITRLRPFLLPAAFLLLSLCVAVWLCEGTLSVYQGDVSFPQHETQDTPTAAEPQITGVESQPEAEPPVEEESYDFSMPAPESNAAPEEYFADAAFVGDSRTDGLLLYSGIEGGKNLSANGLSIFKLAKDKVISMDGQKLTLLQALAKGTYGKVYLSLGINELGYFDDDGFYTDYCAAIDDIRDCQPDAVIYIQNLIPVNEEVIAATGGRTYLTNEHLRVYNQIMARVAEEKQVVYLNLYAAFADESGALPADASNDGVHLKRSYCAQWLAYLQSHIVTPEELADAVV